MKNNLLKIVFALALVVGAQTQLHAQGTTFTYQGRLNFNGAPAAGNFDLRFAVFDANTNGNQFGGWLTNTTAAVTNGLFIVTLDFGAGIFTGPDRWLEIAARTNGGGAFILLTPRQAITPTPYAIFAGSASNLTGVVNSAQLGGGFVGNAFQFTNNRNVFIGEGSGLSGVNANSLNGLQAGNFWQTTGNSGTSPLTGNFLGTTDNQPLDLRVNNIRTLRLEPRANGSPNVIVGFTGNQAGGNYGATISGGGGTNSGPNTVTGFFGTIGGGEGNSASFDATVSGGHDNSAAGQDATIGGGDNKSATSIEATVSGGGGNHAVGGGSTIGGGTGNKANGPGVFIGGGGYDGNYVSGNRADAPASSIVGGVGNNIGTNASWSAIGGGYGNNLNYYANLSSIGGGYLNTISAVPFLGISGATIGGGSDNTIDTNATLGFIGGGSYNYLNSYAATIGGGSENSCSGQYATVPGGSLNVASGQYSFAAGQSAQANHQGAFVWSDSQSVAFSSTGNDQFLIRAQGGVGINTNSPVGGGLTVNGKITSPQWKVSTVVSTSGPLPKSGNLTTSGGTLLIFISGSGYSTSASALIGMDLKIDGSAYTSATIYANSALTHMAFVPNMVVRAGLAAGVHTLSLAARSGTTTDASDSFIITVQELPF